ncbi:hypothetical protein GC173_05505 [bacterium]|nr:hypothetical protein [bacterium]
MSSDSIPSSDGGADRRRESRRLLVSRCSLAITSPAWAITPYPLAGRTININTIGMKIGSISAPAEQVIAWREVILDDVELMIQVTIEGMEQLPVLKGRLVWVYPEEPTEEGPTCSFGILFSAGMDQEDRRILADLVRGLPERF